MKFNSIFYSVCEITMTVKVLFKNRSVLSLCLLLLCTEIFLTIILFFFHRWFTHFYVVGSSLSCLFLLMLVLHCFHGATSVPKAMSHILSLHFTPHIDCFTAFVSLFLLLVQTCRRLYECCFISVFSSRIHILHYFVGIAFYILDTAAVAVPFLKAEQIDKGKINVNLLVNFIKEGRKICYYCSAPINVKLGEAGHGVLKENLK